MSSPRNLCNIYDSPPLSTSVSKFNLNYRRRWKCSCQSQTRRTSAKIGPAEAFKVLHRVKDSGFLPCDTLYIFVCERKENNWDVGRNVSGLLLTVFLLGWLTEWPEGQGLLLPLPHVCPHPSSFVLFRYLQFQHAMSSSPDICAISHCDRNKWRASPLSSIGRCCRKIDSLTCQPFSTAPPPPLFYSDWLGAAL